MAAIVVTTTRGPLRVELDQHGQPAEGWTVLPPTAAERRRAPFADRVGPRKVGGVYWSGSWGVLYEVTALQVDRTALDAGRTAHEGGRPSWPSWQITVQDLTGDTPGRVREHCTAWDYRRDLVVQDPTEVAR
jgi:hypothetical protein